MLLHNYQITSLNVNTKADGDGKLCSYAKAYVTAARQHFVDILTWPLMISMSVTGEAGLGCGPSPPEARPV